MAGLFDELFSQPETGGDSSSQPSPGGLFDELIPQADPNQSTPLERATVRPPARPYQAGEMQDRPSMAESSTPLPPPDPRKRVLEDGIQVPDVPPIKDGDFFDPAATAGLTLDSGHGEIGKPDPGATPRTGGAILDKGAAILDSLFGTGTGAMDQDRAYLRKQKEELKAQQNLEEKQRQRDAFTGYEGPAPTTGNPLLDFGASQQQYADRIDAMKAQRGVDEAIQHKVQTGLDPLQSQTAGRNIAETTLQAGIGIPQGVADAGLQLTEGVARLTSDPAAAQGLQQARQIVDQFASSLAHGDTARKDDFNSQMAQGVGSSAGFLAAGMIGKALGLSEAVVTALAGALPQASQMYAEAEAKGGTEGQKWGMFTAGLGLGATEALPIASLFESLNHASSGALDRIIKTVLPQIGEEGGQEMFQQGGQNVATRVLGVDPDRRPAEGVLSSGAVGALSGAGQAGAASVAQEGALAARNALNQLQQPPEVPQDIQQAILQELRLPQQGQTAQAPNAPIPPVPVTPTPVEGFKLSPQPSPVPGPAPTGAAPVEPDPGPVGAPGQAPGVEGQPETVRAPVPSEQPPSSGAGVQQPAEGASPAPAPNGQSGELTEDEARLLWGTYEPEMILDMTPEERRATIEDLTEHGALPEHGLPLPPELEALTQPTIAHQPLMSNSGTNPEQTDGADGADGNAGRRSAPIAIQNANDLTRAGSVAKEPTEGQAKAGNYQHGHATWNGIPVAIETPKGGTRKGTDANGQPWEVEMPATYGRVKRTKGADGEEIDIYLGDNPESDRVWIVDQQDPGSRKFDEHKIMAGFGSQEEALAAYEQAYDDAAEGRVRSVKEMSVDELKDWLKNPQEKPAERRRNAPAPKDLVGFLASRGGLRPDPELTARDLHRLPVPGHGRLVRQNGMSLDEAREAAVEAGFLQDSAAEGSNLAPGSGVTRSSVDDLLRALDDHMQGRRTYSDQDSQAVAERKAKRDEERANDPVERAYYAEQQVLDELDAVGMRRQDIDADALERATDLVLNGMDPADAWERAVLEAVAEDADGAHIYEEAGVELPGWDDATEGTATQDARQGDEGGGEARGGELGTGPAPEPALQGADRGGDLGGEEGPGSGEAAPGRAGQGRPVGSGLFDELIQQAQNDIVETEETDAEGVNALYDDEAEAPQEAAADEAPEPRPGKNDKKVRTELPATAGDLAGFLPKDAEGDTDWDALRQAIEAVTGQRQVWGRLTDEQKHAVLDKLEGVGATTAESEKPDDISPSQAQAAKKDDYRHATGRALAEGKREFAHGIRVEIENRYGTTWAVFYKNDEKLTEIGKGIESRDKWLDITIGPYVDALVLRQVELKTQREVGWPTGGKQKERYERGQLESQAFYAAVEASGAESRDDLARRQDLHEAFAAAYADELRARMPEGPVTTVPTVTSEEQTPSAEEQAPSESGTATPVSPVNGKPLTKDPKGTLVLMACADKKKPTETAIPLLDLYDGPNWETLRKHRGEIPDGNLFTLSGKFGFRSAMTYAKPYNERISKQKVDALIERGIHENMPPPSGKGMPGPNIYGEVHRDESRGGPYTQVVIVGNGEYRRAFDFIVSQLQAEGVIAADAPIVAAETTNPDPTKKNGNGVQRSQLGAFLRTANGLEGKVSNTDTSLESAAPAFEAGQRVRWTDLVGKTRTGTIESIEDPESEDPVANIKIEGDPATYIERTYNLTRAEEPSVEPGADGKPFNEYGHYKGQRVYVIDNFGKERFKGTVHGPAAQGGGVLVTEDGKTHGGHTLVDNPMRVIADHTTEPGAEGKPQTLIPGVEPVTDKDRLDVAADKPLAPKVPQKGPGGLFGDDRNQTDLFDAPKVRSQREMKEEAKKIAADMDAIGTRKAKRDADDILNAIEMTGVLLTEDTLRAWRRDLKRHIEDAAPTEEASDAGRDGVQPAGDALRQGAEPASEGSAPGDVSGADGGGPVGSPLPGDRDAGGGAVSDAASGDVQRQPAPAGGTGTSEGAGASAAGGKRDGDERRRAAAERLKKAEEEARKAVEQRARKNYQITDKDEIGQGSAREKIRANIAAIRLAKQILSENREATEDEKKVLVKYVGWGAFAQQVFHNRYETEFAEERKQLQTLLSDQEYEAAKGSTLNAHYTSAEVIKGVWDAVQHLGFEGGTALEPSAGVGHFIGMTPGKLRTKTAWTGVELDKITGQIAKLLYAGADMNVQGFETLERPNNYYDLAISNVPFGDYGITDKRYPKPDLLIHDYFFVRALDMVRPGGIVAFITSNGTMDKARDRARRLIDERGEFIGAIRLPGGKKGAFAGNAGTDVTTDIIFVRKRAPGEVSGMAKPWNNVVEIDTQDGKAPINEYFQANPKMMLGTPRYVSSRYARPTFTLEGDTEDLAGKIKRAAQKGLPKGIMQAAPQSAATVASLSAADVAELQPGAKEGGFFVGKDGQIYRKKGGTGEPVDIGNFQDAERMRQLIAIRDIVVPLLEAQRNGRLSDAERDQLRADLKKAHAKFVKQFGPINKTVQQVSDKRKDKRGNPIVTIREPNISKFRPDPDSYVVRAIEIYDEETDTATLAAIAEKDVIRPPEDPIIATAADALAVSLNRFANVNLPFMAESLGMSQEEVVAELGTKLWLDPNGGVYRTDDEYLSGNVRQKLREAEAAARQDRRYEANVEALKAVQPEPLTSADIKVQFGAPWVPLEVYNDFIENELGLSNIKAKRNSVVGTWSLDGYGSSTAFEAQYGSLDRLEDALNNKMPTIYKKRDRGSDEKPQIDAEATEKARLQVQAIRDRFSGNIERGVESWVWENDARAEVLEGIYNEQFNATVLRKYDGSHQTFPGLAKTIKVAGQVRPFSLVEHQSNAVWRTVQNGNTLYGHVVGAGKTFTMIAAGMEMKRLGLVRKPIYCVPNHMLEQFSREFLQAYPAARLLIAQKEEVSKDERGTFVAKAATQDWDAVIMTHDAFKRIPTSPEWAQEYLNQQLEELEDAIREAKGDRATVKEIERAKKALESRLKKLMDEGSKDKGVTFEQMGVDFIFLDEAHLYKNLSFVTRMGRVKGLAQGNAQRAEDMFLKILYLDSLKPGRSAAFATGTPISNTMAEMYTMQRYLQLRRLREMGLSRFDDWASTFGQIVTKLALAPDARTFREETSFSRFVNIPELMQVFNEVADMQTADMLNLPRPQLSKRPDGTRGIQIVEAEPNEREESYIQSLVDRAQELKDHPPKPGTPGADNMLKIVGEGRKVATDFRLIDPRQGINPDGKIAKAIENIARIYHEGKDPALGQVVFLDMGVPNAKNQRVQTLQEDDPEDLLDADTPFNPDDIQGGYDLYSDIRDRLVAKGIPAREIAFIHDADDDLKKARLFAKVRSGEVRVLLGTTGKMGVGTNVQERLIAMHHLDAPWKPAEVEQRDGRILRQGNLNMHVGDGSVQIYRYVTKRSFDAFMWQKLEDKATFIGQVLSGAKGVRSAEDIDPPIPEAAEMKAAASGDPRVLEFVNLKKEVMDLGAQKRAHERTKARTGQALQWEKEMVAGLEKRIPEAQKDEDAYKPMRGDAFDWTIPGMGQFKKEKGESGTARQRAGQAIFDYVTQRKTQYYQKQTLDLGTFEGMAAQLDVRTTYQNDATVVLVRPIIRTPSGSTIHAQYEYGIPQSGTAEDLAKEAGNLVNVFAHLTSSLAGWANHMREQVAEKQKEIAKLEHAKANEKPWPLEAKFKEASQRLRALEEIFRREEADRLAAKAGKMAEKEAASLADVAPVEEAPKEAEETVREPGDPLDQLRAIDPAATPGGQLRASRGLPQRTPGLYSAALKAVERAKIAKGKPSQWFATIKNTSGVKPEELEWLGLETWLREQSDRTLTRDEVAAFIRANDLEVAETVYGNGETRFTGEQALAYLKAAAEEDGSPDPEEEYGYSNLDDYIPMAMETADLLDQEWGPALHRETLGHVLPGGTGTNGRPRYQTYSTQGAKGYRELLLQLPVKTTPLTFSARQMASGRWEVVNDVSGAVIMGGLQETNARRVAEEYTDDAKRDGLLEESGPRFDSSHWDVPNVVAHIRFNEQTVNGKQTLFIEEIQSDWHQAGRKFGYRTEETQKRIAALEAKESSEWTPEDTDWYNSTVHDKITDSTPDAPFKTTWQELALKRAIRWAVDNGFQQIAWNTGARNAARFGLDKHFSAIELEQAHGVTELVAYPPEGERRMPTRHRIFDDIASEAGKRDIARYIGEELAGRLLASPVPGFTAITHRIAGDDLKMEGSGMRGFYDKILVDAAGKLGKKFGAKVTPFGGTTDLGATAHVMEITPSMQLAVTVDGLPKYRTAPEASIDEAGILRFRPETWSPDQRKAVLDAIGEAAVRVAGPDVGVYVRNYLFTQAGEATVASGGTATTGEEEVGGLYNIATFAMTISLGKGDPLVSTYHESWHHLQNLGVIKAAEMRFLERQRKALEAMILRAYPDVNPDTLARMPQYEIEAYAFQTYAQDRAAGEGEHIGIRRVFEKVKQFLRAVYNGLQGKGFYTETGIMEAAWNGSLARRGAEQIRGQGVRYSAASFSTAKQQEAARLNQIHGVGPTAAPTPPTGPTTFTAPEATRFSETQRRLQNEFEGLAKIQSAIEDFRGAPLAEPLNAYLATTLFRSKTPEAVATWKRDTVDPLIEAMRDEGISSDDLGWYLYAKHAPDRNAVMAQRDPARFGTDGGSGLANGTASDIISDYAARGMEPALQRLAQRVYDLLKDDRDRRVRAGLMTAQQAQEWEQTMGPFYVPLRGVSEIDPDATSADRPRVGRKFNIRGKEAQTAMGRESLPDNPLFYAISMGEEGIVRAEKNRVGKTLLALAQRNPNPDVWEVVKDASTKLPRKKVIDPATGQVKMIPDMGATHKDGVIGVKVGGNQYYLRLTNKGLAEAFYGLGTPQFQTLVERYLAKFGRYFSQINTARNPEFFIPNAIRDVQEASVTLAALDPKLVPGFLAAWPRAFAAAAAYEAGRPIPRGMGTRLEEWRRAGGKIGYNGFRDIETLSKEIKDELDELDQNAVRRIGHKAWRKLKGALDGMNGTFESATRLAVYHAAREKGYTPARAAELSLEATVNFNKRGTWSPHVNMLWVFYNASIQGNAKMLGLLKNSNKARVIYASFIGLGYALALWNRAAAGDDDDEKGRSLYDKIPAWDRQSNLILVTGKVTGEKDVGYVKLPLAFGLKIPFYIGEQIAAVQSGAVKPWEAAGNVFQNTVDAFNPLGQGNILNVLAPTLLDPIVDLVRNRDYRDAPIRPDEREWNSGVPASSQHFNSTNPVAVMIAEAVNKASGGDRFQKGLFDIAPDHIEYAVGWATGGFGRFVMNGYQGVANWAQGVETPPEKWPVARRFYGQTGLGADQSRYYDVREETQASENRYNAAKKALQTNPNDAEAREAMIREGKSLGINKPAKKGGATDWDGTRVELFNKGDKAVKSLRTAINVARQAKDQAEVKRLEGELRRVMNAYRSANDQVKRARGVQEERVEEEGLFSGMMDKLFGPDTSTKTLETDKPGFPSKEDAELARKSGFGYGRDQRFIDGDEIPVAGTTKTVTEPLPKGAKKGAKPVQREVFEPGDIDAFDRDTGQLSKAAVTPGRSRRLPNEDPEIRDNLTRSALAANRTALSTLGFNPARTAFDVRSGETTTRGLYAPDADSLWVNSMSKSTMAHESTHRGLEKVRQDRPDLFKDWGVDEESMVRWIVHSRMGDPESGTGSAADKQIRKARAYFEGDDVVSKANRARLDAIEAHAAEMIRRDRPRGGPR